VGYLLCEFIYVMLLSFTASCVKYCATMYVLNLFESDSAHGSILIVLTYTIEACVHNGVIWCGAYVETRGTYREDKPREK